MPTFQLLNDLLRKIYIDAKKEEIKDENALEDIQYPGGNLFSQLLSFLKFLFSYTFSSLRILSARFSHVIIKQNSVILFLFHIPP